MGVTTPESKESCGSSTTSISPMSSAAAAVKRLKPVISKTGTGEESAEVSLSKDRVLSLIRDNPKGIQGSKFKTMYCQLYPKDPMVIPTG